MIGSYSYMVLVVVLQSGLDKFAHTQRISMS